MLEDWILEDTFLQDADTEMMQGYPPESGGMGDKTASPPVYSVTSLQGQIFD